MRKYRRPGAVEALAADLAHVRVREWLRQEIWNLLRQAGLVAAPEPPVLPRRPKPALRIVVSDPGSMPKESNGIETEKQ